MFTVTDNATTAIRQIVTRPGVPHGAGVRIAANDDHNSLRMVVSPMPEPGDTVFQAAADAALFIADDAEELLDDKVIDAVTDDDGRVEFILEAPAR